MCFVIVIFFRQIIKHDFKSGKTSFLNLFIRLIVNIFFCVLIVFLSVRLFFFVNLYFAPMDSLSLLNYMQATVLRRLDTLEANNCRHRDGRDGQSGADI